MRQKATSKVVRQEETTETRASERLLRLGHGTRALEHFLRLLGGPSALERQRLLRTFERHLCRLLRLPDQRTRTRLRVL